MAKYKDADELLKRLNSCKFSREKPTKRQVTYNYAISQACRIVDALPAVDEYDVVAEYCRKRRLVIITADLFEKIKREYVGEEYWIR